MPSQSFSRSAWRDTLKTSATRSYGLVSPFPISPHRGRYQPLCPVHLATSGIAPQPPQSAVLDSRCSPQAESSNESSNGRSVMGDYRQVRLVKPILQNATSDGLSWYLLVLVETASTELGDRRSGVQISPARQTKSLGQRTFLTRYGEELDLGRARRLWTPPERPGRARRVVGVVDHRMPRRRRLSCG